MSDEIRANITREFGFEPVKINSALVSAQMRKRLYWVGKRVGDEYVRVDIPQPKDRGVVLKDIIEGQWESDREKAVATTATIARRTPIDYVERHNGGELYAPAHVMCLMAKNLLLLMNSDR